MTKKEKQPETLKQLFLKLFVGKILFPSLIIGILVTAIILYFSTRNISVQQTEIAQSLVSRLEDHLSESSNVLGAIANQVDSEDGMVDLSKYINSIWRSYRIFDTIYQADTKGKILRMAPADARSLSVNLSGFNFFKTVIQQDLPYISDPIQSIRSGHDTIMVTYPLQSGGVILGEINLTELYTYLLRENQSSRSYQMRITDRDGKYFPTIDHLLSPTIFPLPKQSEGSTTWVVNDRQLYVISQVYIPSTGWTLIVQTPVLPVYGQYLWISLITLLFFIVTWTYMIFHLRGQLDNKITKPLAVLAYSVSAFADGDITAPTIPANLFRPPFKEMQTLVAKFEKMRLSIHDRQVLIMDSEHKYRSLIEQSSDGIFLRVNNHFEIVNPSLCELFEITEEEILAPNFDLMTLIAPESHAIIEERLNHPKTGNPIQSRYQFTGITRTGQIKEFEISAKQFSYHHEIASQGIIRDITDRAIAERAEHEQRTLAEALRDAAMVLNSTLNVDEVMDRILGIVGRVVPHLAGNIMLFDDQGNARVVRHRGYDEMGLSDWVAKVQFNLEEIPNFKKMISEGKPLLVSDTQSEPTWITFPESTWIRSYISAPIFLKNQIIGFLNLDSEKPNFFQPIHAEHLQSFATQAGIAIHNAQLLHNLQNTNQSLVTAYDTTLLGWSKALELRDYETEGHTQRVLTLTLELSKIMGCTDDELIHIRRGVLLHDIGKIGIPDRILTKPGPLTDEEWEIMRMHPVYAYQILTPIPYLQASLDIPYGHHERWDGSGYPRGLKGTQIPLAARIFAVVDVWDALHSNRPYRSSVPMDQVIAYLKEQAGIQFDPQIVETFVELLKTDPPSV